MHEGYPDITSRITEEPRWYDENGVPRYCEFEPRRCPCIYADTVVLLYIRCQYCGRGFMVEMSWWNFRDGEMPPPKTWHYGDPPVHGDHAGETMNCDDIEVKQVWRRGADGWDMERQPELEGPWTGQPPDGEIVERGQ